MTVPFGNGGYFQMRSLNSEFSTTEITLIVVIVALLILLPPMLGWWGASKNPWYIPYLVWSIIIALAYWLQRILRKHAV